MYDITYNVLWGIQEYVNEEFSSSPCEYDLLQDVKTIKRVFGKDSNLMSNLAKKIGKISSQCLETKIMNDEFKLFNSKIEPCSFGKFHETIGEIFCGHKEFTYDSELDCIFENLRLFQNPISNYIKAAHYETSLEAIRNLKDNCSNNDEEINDDINKVDVSKKHPLFIENPFLKKYNSFEALRPLFRLQDIEYGRTFIRIDVKQSETLIRKAEEELYEKCFQLNENQYGEIKTQFGLIITGVEANLFLMSFDPTSKKEFGEDPYFSYRFSQSKSSEVLFHLNRYELYSRRDRELLAFSLMVLTEISKQLSKKYSPSDEFLKFKHPDTVKRTDHVSFDTRPYWMKNQYYAEINFNYLLNMVEKKVYDENRMSARELLNRFNKLIAYGNESQIGSIRPITDTVKVTKYNPRSKVYKVWIEPIGYAYEATMCRVRRSIREFKKAIICVMEAALSIHANGFVHRDIAWRNITYDRENDTYLLFDFELIGKLCNRSCRDVKHRGFHCSPAILDAAYILKLFDHPKIRFSQFDEYSSFASELYPNEIVCYINKEESRKIEKVDGKEEKENEEETKDEKDEPSLKIRKLNNEEDEEADENKENSPVLVNEENVKDVKKDQKDDEEDEEDEEIEDENDEERKASEFKEEANIKKQNETIAKIKELFWKFYLENINEFKPNLSQEDIQKRKMDSAF